MWNAVIGKFNIGFRRRGEYSMETNVGANEAAERTSEVSSPVR